ncbi:MAG: hypothetical protein EZS28_021470 [Streblomastix strix]|uniref:Potassium channel tetramerisation-type BTB domain-containing protein n=1 Tax=Streblomastix strix TaxID=222440 RepID=A0A5J4VK35_9EUKA|nr:MAG: hypothetical protein EZS28_021470 [Streblomastix strix]
MKALDEQEKQLQAEREKLDKEKSVFQRIKSENAKPGSANNNEEILELNVGGKVFTTLRKTLVQNKDSVLAQLCTGKNQQARDKDGRIFIDRSPKTFALILEYLRTDVLPIAFSTTAQEKEFQKDLEFYSLGPTFTPFHAVWSEIHKSQDLQVRDNGKTVEVIGEDGDHTIVIGDQKIMHGIVNVTVQVTIPRPNRYSFGVLPELPPNFNRGFGYKNGMLGWGLHDHTESLGIFCQTQLVAKATGGYVTGDYVTLTVDVDRGDLSFKVNGMKVSELLNCEIIQLGVYVAATLFNKGTIWQLVPQSSQ